MRRLLAVLALLSMASTAAAANAPAPQDFAYGMRLIPSGAEAVQELPLPEEVYRASIRPGLADISVFNGRGEPVPFGIFNPVREQAPTELRQLRLFQLPGAATGSGSAISLQVETDFTGAIVRLATSPEPSGNGAFPPGQYLIDATSQDRPLSALILEWDPSAENYLGTISVAVSNDLRNWTDHARGPIATLQNGGEALTQRSVEFAPARAKYFLLTLSPHRGIPHLTGASGRLAQVVAEPARSWLSPTAEPEEGDSGGYLVDTGGRFPVDRIRVRFHDENSIARVAFYSRADSKASWTLRQRALVYHLRQEGRVLESPDVELRACPDRYWLLRVEKSGELGSAPPLLEMGWIPHRLDFVARGPAPFLLAYGSSHPGSNALRDDTLLCALGAAEPGKVRAAAATAGREEQLAGRTALKGRVPARTWKLVSLWGVLVLAVLFLAGMAVRLWRQMGNGGE